MILVKHAASASIHGAGRQPSTAPAGGRWLQVAIDRVSLDEADHQVARLEGEVEQARARSTPEGLDQLDGALAQARDHLAAVAARRAPADPCRPPAGPPTTPRFGPRAAPPTARCSRRPRPPGRPRLADQARAAAANVGRGGIVGRSAIARPSLKPTARSDLQQQVVALPRADHAWKASSSASLIAAKARKNGLAQQVAHRLAGA
jgi:hypothetical protein